MSVKKIGWFFPICLLSYVILSLGVSAVMAAMKGAGVAIPEWISYVSSELVMLLLGILYMAIVGVDPLKDIPYRRLRSIDCILSLITGYCMIPLILLINVITMLFSKNYLNESAQDLLAFPFAVQIIIIAVIPALVEELVFRGLFFGAYRRVGFVGAAVMSGLIFGCFHLNINQFAYAFVMGIFFAYMVEATGSLWSSVLAHFAINTYSVSLQKIIEIAAGKSETVQASMEASKEVSLADLSTSALVGEIVFVCVLVAIFTPIAVACLRAMAARNGRLENISIKRKTEREGKYLTIPAFAGFVSSFAFMIFIEIASNVAK